MEVNKHTTNNIRDSRVHNWLSCLAMIDWRSKYTPFHYLHSTQRSAQPQCGDGMFIHRQSHTHMYAPRTDVRAVKIARFPFSFLRWLFWLSEQVDKRERKRAANEHPKKRTIELIKLWMRSQRPNERNKQTGKMNGIAPLCARECMFVLMFGSIWFIERQTMVSNVCDISCIFHIWRRQRCEYQAWKSHDDNNAIVIKWYGWSFRSVQLHGSLDDDGDDDVCLIAWL